VSDPAPRKTRHRRTTAEVNAAGDRWKRRPVNIFGSPNASQAEAPRIAVVFRSTKTIQFLDWSNFIRACRLLEREGKIEFFEETEFQEGDDEQQPV
jgi:hypothetical protein